MFKHVNWASAKSETLNPSVERQYISTEHMTIARFRLKKGIVVPTHQHPNEQVANTLKGALKFTLAGKEVIVRINDRGPFHSDRVIDLSYAAAYRLGFIGAGSGEVQIEAIVR